MTNSTTLFISRDDVRKIGVSYGDVVDVLEKAFAAQAEGKVRMAKKASLRFPEKDGAFINSLPAYIETMNVAGIKWVSGFVEATRRGLPYVMGVIILNDGDTGRPIAIMDGTLITEMRTAGVSAIAARALMSRKSRCLGIVGCGAQGRAHFQAMTAIWSFERALCYDVVPGRADEAAKAFSRDLGIKVEAADSPKAVLESSDVVATCTVPSAPFLDVRWVKPGATVVSIEGRQTWQSDSYRVFEKLCVDEWESIREGAHLKQVLAGGYLDSKDIWAELADLISGRKCGRSSDSERILVLTRGLGMEDVAVAHHVLTLAVERGIGTRLNLL